jgi:hypothetical protein
MTEDSEHHLHDGKKHLFDDPKNVRRVRQALYVICGLSLVAELVVHRHVDHPWEIVPIFYAIYGFAACVILVLAATEMRKVLMRGEDYYDDV